MQRRYIYIYGRNKIKKEKERESSNYEKYPRFRVESASLRRHPWKTGILLAGISVASAERRTVCHQDYEGFRKEGEREREKGEKVFVTSSFPTELVVLTTARHFEPAKRTRVEGPVEKDRKGVEGGGWRRRENTRFSRRHGAEVQAATVIVQFAGKGKYRRILRKERERGGERG